MLKLLIMSKEGFEVITFKHESNARYRLTKERESKTTVALFLYDKNDELLVATEVMLRG